MGLFDTMREPVFLKQTSQAEEQLQELQRLLQNATGDVRDDIERDIKLLSYGLEGERNIAFELSNSHMPMYILHDLYLQCGPLTAQIDYLVITRGLTFVIECKNLIGNIEINSNGDFIRSYNWGRKSKKEGIYSPITQNNRHLELMKQIQCQGKNMLRTALIDKKFYLYNKSIVVLSNPKTILNARYAKKEIKDQVIRVDQLIEFIKRENNRFTGAKSSDLQMLENAKFYLGWNRECQVDYIQKYRLNQVNTAQAGGCTFVNETPMIENNTYNTVQTVGTNNNVYNPQNVMEAQGYNPNVSENAINRGNEPVSNGKNQEDLIADLKKYRLLNSRKENLKPYFIFNDAQMMDLIQKMPRNCNELLGVSGFGAKKCEKYGVELMEILWK